MSTLPASVRPRTFDSVHGRRYRPFGSDFAPQRHVYLFYLPVTLILFGVAIWLVPNNATFVLGSLIGTLVGLYVLADVLFREAPLRFTTLYGSTLLVAYNMGAFNSWLNLDRGGLTVAEFFGRDPAALARAIAACLATAAVLIVAGEIYERPLFGREFHLVFEGNTLLLIIASTVLLVGGHATGQLGFEGINVDPTTGGHINPITALIMWWSIPAFGYSVCAALNTAGTRRWVIGVCAVIQGLALVPFGRRIFGFSVVVAFIATRLGRFRSRMPVFKKLLLAAAGCGLIVTASVAFLYLRFVQWEHRDKVSIGTQIGLAADMVSKRSPSEILQFMGRDTAGRTFIVAFFSDLLDASQRSTPLLGTDLLYNLQLAVPTALSANKFGLGLYGEELQANMQWGFSYIDEPNSLITAGAADFGLIGVFVYPLLFLLLLRAALEWIQLVVPTYVAVIIALAFTFETLVAEDVPVAYFSQIRNALLISLLFYGLTKLPIFRLRSD